MEDLMKSNNENRPKGEPPEINPLYKQSPLKFKTPK